jgi:hypothetical protein
MSAFSSEWLTLREPYDKAARNSDVLQAVAEHAHELPTIRIADLACGTGSTLRAIGGKLPPGQSWRLVDNNLSLLARAPAQKNVKTLTVDISRDLELALDGALDLVTTSALLDLVSSEWLERLAVEIAVRKLPLYAALSYDGRITFTPSDPLDARVTAAVNEHQHSDKGFGPALGPAAAAAAIERFAQLSYSVKQGQSDWKLRPVDRRMQLELLAGWALAASEVGSLPADELADWLKRRSDYVASGVSVIEVGHIDFFARHTETR